jgi:hypothetical protein
MAIRVQTAGRTDLRLATRVDKVNFNTPRTIAGAAGQVRGNWQAVFLRMPSGLTTNADFNLLGHNQINDGLFTGSAPGDARLRIASETVTTVARRLRPMTERRSGTTQAYNANTWLDIDQVPTGAGTSFIYIEGIRNVGDNVTPNWVAFAAICPINGGAPSVQVQTANSAYITGGGAMLSQIIVAQNGTANRITPAGFVFEQYLLAEGDFPWHTSTDAGVTGAGRPHLDALRALANGANPPGTLHTYDSLIAAQNAGTLGYANLNSGRSEKRIHYTLENLSSAGLTEQVAGTNNLTVTTQAAPGDGLVVENTILPAHWAPGTPVITDPRLKFFGGRGLLPVVISGTHTGNVERRWVLAGTSTPVAGFNWALRTVTNEAWSTSDTLPPGHYDLQVRDAATPANVATLPDILVGTKLLFHGQSGMEIAILGASNPDSLPVAAGAQGILCRPTNYNAPNGTTTMNVSRLVGGQAPAQSYMAIELLNRWNALNPGHPLMINVMAINGTTMDTEWAANATIGGWTFLGAVTDGVGAGVVGFWAWFLSQQIDGHVLMWHPGMGSTEAGRQQYIDAIDARFANSPQAPWMILPSWRGHRASTGSDGIVVRDNAVRMVQQLGPRGYLGSQWSDILADGNPLPATPADPGSLHPARKGSGVVSDANVVGASRAARGLAAEGARLFNQTVQRTFRIGGITPSNGGAWSDNGGATVQVELGRKARTLNGAAIHTPMISISLDSGSSWNNNGDTFTAAFDATSTRLVLTPTAGNLAAWQSAFSAGTLRVDYGRVWPFSPATGNLNEATIEPAFDGLIYDMATWRGRDNLAVPAGNVLQGTNRSAGANAGVPVVAKGNPKLVTTERMSGPRTVTVRMRRVSDDAVLASRTFNLTTTS